MNGILIFIFIFIFIFWLSPEWEEKSHFLCRQHYWLLYASAICFLILSRMRTSVPAISQALGHLETDPPKTVEDVECILKVHLIIYPGASQFFLCFKRTEVPCLPLSTPWNLHPSFSNVQHHFRKPSTQRNVTPANNVLNVRDNAEECRAECCRCPENSPCPTQLVIHSPPGYLDIFESVLKYPQDLQS